MIFGTAMHVAYIHQHFAVKTGSTGTRSYEMSRRLLDAGHRVTMICGAYEPGGLNVGAGQGVIENDIDGIRVLCVTEPYGNRMGFVRRVQSFGRFARAAERVVSRLDAELVFATSTPLTVGLPGMKGAKRLGVPFVFEVRDLWPDIPIAIGAVRNPVLAWYLRRMERKIYRAADRMIALAPGIKDGICKTGFAADKVAVIPNCCDLELFQPNDGSLDEERFGPADDFRLVFTGAHGLCNGLDAVLDAVAELKRRGQTGLRFVFIGDGNQRDRLVRRSEQEGIASMISWVRPVPKDELARLLPRMDAGMMILKNLPVFYEGTSPNKFFDYIASGLPVLNNYPGWVARLIEENECGLVVRPDAPGAFADAVIHLRDNRDQRQAMGQRSRQLAESRFSRDRLGELFVQTLEQARREF